MPGPETDPGTDPPEAMHPAVDVSDLEAARTALGHERTHVATSWRDKEGVTKLDNNPDHFDADPSSTTGAERVYWAEVRQNIEDGARELKERGATTEQIRAYMCDLLIKEQMERVEAEVDAKANPNTRLGRVKAKVVGAIRKHHKTRIALGIGLSVGAVVATAGGAGGVALGVIAARAALAAPGYVGFKDMQEVAGNRLAHGSKGKLARLDQDQIDAMTSDQRLQHLTRLLAAEARTTRNDKQAKGDDKVVEMLFKKEREELHARLDEAAETYRGSNLIRGAIQALDHRVAEQLAVERKQLIDDKKLNRRRTLVAGSIAGALAGYTVVAGIAHDGITLGHHAARVAHGAVASHHGGGAGPTEHAGAHGAHAEHHGGVHSTETGAATPETHPSSFEHYPEIITDQVNKGDTPVRVAMKHLSRIQGWDHFSAEQQHEKIMHFANQLTKSGDHWRYTKEAIQASYHFDHSAVVQPDHMMPGSDHAPLPGYEQVTPSGSGAEHILSNGGVATPDTHEFALAPDYPEIVTQHVRMGDTAMRVAQQHLSRIPGWDVFSPEAQHQKALHFAKQLRRTPDSWRYTKEAIQASFNFK